jgi:hypothetical protein
VASHHNTQGQIQGGNRLDALLADLDDSRELTAVDDRPFVRDPISEVIARNPRRAEALVQPRRVPSLDDPDDDTPLPPPRRDSDYDIPVPVPTPAATPPGGMVSPAASATNAADEAAAMSALAGLDDPARRVSTAAEQASHAADKLEQAARRVEAAAVVTARSSQARPPIIDPPLMEELPPVRLKSRALGIVSLLVVVGGAIGFYVIYQNQQEATAAAKVRDEEAKRKAEETSEQLRKAQADMGRISVSSTPSEASVWVKLGRTSLDSFHLPSSQMHRIRIERDGYQPVDTEVVAASWEGTGLSKKAKVSVTLKPLVLDKKTHQPQAAPLPALPPNLPEQTGFTAGEGPVHIETSPPGAEVWLLIGFANTGVNFPTVAGRAYELRALADGYKPGYASVTADEWRDPKGDPREPIDVAKKKEAIEKHIDLEVDPDAKPLAPRPGAKPGPKPRK